MTIRARSGNVNTTDPFVTFVYLLLRDHVLAGDMEAAVKQVTGKVDLLIEKAPLFEFSNGWLASYAEDVVRRVRGADLPEPTIDRDPGKAL